MLFPAVVKSFFFLVSSKTSEVINVWQDSTAKEVNQGLDIKQMGLFLLIAVLPGNRKFKNGPFDIAHSYRYAYNKMR